MSTIGLFMKYYLQTKSYLYLSKRFGSRITSHISRSKTFLLVFLFQITWARQLQVANTSYQILTIGESTYIDDSRFIIDTSTVNYVRL